MNTDDKTGVLTSLDVSDIGSSVEDAVVEVRKVFYVSSDGRFISFAAGNFSCVSRLGKPVADGMRYRVSGTVGEYKGKASLELSSIEAFDEEEKETAAALRFIEYLKDKSYGVADKEIASVLKDNIIDEILQYEKKEFKDKHKFAKAKKEDLKILHDLIEKDPDMSRRIMGLVKAGFSSPSIKRCRKAGLLDDDILRDNPYSMYFGGIASFAECDRLAGEYGIDPEFEFRLEAMALSAVNDICYKKSSTYAGASEYANAMKMILRDSDIASFSDTDDNLIFDAARRAADNGRLNIYRTDRGIIEDCDVTDEGARLAASQFYYYEASASEAVCDLIDSEVPIPSRNEAFEVMDKIADEMGIVLDGSQREAVYMAMYQPLCVITGGPGSGKTTIMGVLGRFFEERKIKVAFAAPTGRAAKRLSDSAGVEAKTIHRLLEITPDVFNDSFSFGKDSSNPIDARVIVIDEMSMVDSALFSRFLDAVAEGTSLILVGDPNQLPSVGPGNVLSDLIGCPSVPHIHLEYQHRSDSEGSIAANAARILESSDLLCDNSSFRLVDVPDENEALEILLGFCDRMDLTDDDYAVLTPTKDDRSLLSTGHLNSELQKMRLAKTKIRKGKEGKALQKGDSVYYVGDRVMQMRNDYKLEWTNPGSDEEEGIGVYNGEIGVITEISASKKKRSVTVMFEDGKIVEYEGESIADLSLAYAVTVHKAQGCEFDTVFIVLGNVNNLLRQRRLLYTAVTRGKNNVVIIDVASSIKRYLNNTREERRPSSLGDFLKINTGDM